MAWIRGGRPLKIGEDRVITVDFSAELGEATIVALPEIRVESRDAAGAVAVVTDQYTIADVQLQDGTTVAFRIAAKPEVVQPGTVYLEVEVVTTDGETIHATGRDHGQPRLMVSHV